MKKCKHSITIMSKKGFNYICNKCGGVVMELDDSNFDDKYSDLNFNDDIFDKERRKEK